jgi:serine/threonine-protein kinase RsbW
MRLHDTVFLHLPAKTRFASPAVAAAREYAAAIGFAGRDLSRICLALEEAFCHAVSLGYGGERDTVRVGLGRTALGLQITILSKGLPLDEETLPRFDPHRLQSEGDMTGMHAHLLRSVVDKAVFATLKGNRRKIMLCINLPVGSAAHGPLEDAPQEPMPADAVPVTTIRPAGPDDAEGIARLALRAHGSLLFSADIYYPARVREMLEQGEMRSMAVVTPLGEILGHGALVAEAPGALVEEMTYAVVDRRLRGRRCSDELAAALLANAHERGLHCLYALAVCNHVLSQRSALAVGFRECALLLAASPPSQSWTKADKGSGAATKPHRIANLQLIRLLRPLPPAPLFVPKRHAAIIHRIRAHLGMTEADAWPTGKDAQQTSRKCSEAARNRLQTGSARIRVETDPKEGWAWIVVLDLGKDAVPRVARQHRRLRAQGLSAIFLMLPLDIPDTATMAQDFEDLGFFFSGITFSPQGQTHLALQYVNGDPGYDAIQVHSPFARELLDYVRARGIGG